MMASENDKKQEAPVITAPKQPQKKYEATYTIPELVAAAATEFKTSTIIVRAALTKAGKESYTLREANQII